MRGIPYWGENTRTDRIALVKMDYQRISIEEIQDLCKSSGVLNRIKDVYSLFLALAELDMLFIPIKDEEWLTWCRDIKFNYRDRFVYMPYLTFDKFPIDTRSNILENPHLDIAPELGEKIVFIRHNYELQTLEVDNRVTGNRLHDIYLYDYKNHKKYHLELPYLPYLVQETFSLKELSRVHTNLACSALTLDSEPEGSRYTFTRVKGSKGYRGAENRYRKTLSLRTYTDNFKDVKYNDIRYYNYENSLEYVDIVDTDKPYWLRQYEFEAMVYCIFAQEIGVEEEDYKEIFNDLGSKRRHLTYKEGHKPLILKYYYKNQFSLRRKSFDMYKEVPPSETSSAVCRK